MNTEHKAPRSDQISSAISSPERMNQPLTQTANALHTAFHAHDLDVPGVDVHQAKIYLGDVSVFTADRLARLLGVPPQEARVNIEEWPDGQRVAHRLGAAFKSATYGGFLDPLFHPDCLRCDRQAAISLGSIDVQTAHRLVTALLRGA